MLLIGAAATLSATATTEESVPDEPMMILYPKTVSSIPVLAAIAENPEQYQGEFYTDHAQALARLLAGEADAIASGFSVGLARYRSAGDIVHVSTSVWGVSALMTGSEISDLTDLAGETVYAPFERSPIDIYLKLVLAQAGILDQVTIAYAPFPQSSALVAQGQAAGSVLVEPIASTLELSGRAFRFQNLHEGWATIAGGEERSPQVSVFTTRSGADESSSRFAMLRSDLEEATQALIADPAGYAAEYAPQLEFPAPVVENALQNALLDTPDPPETRSIIGLYADIIGQERPGPDFYLE